MIWKCLPVENDLSATELRHRIPKFSLDSKRRLRLKGLCHGSPVHFV